MWWNFKLRKGSFPALTSTVISPSPRSLCAGAQPSPLLLLIIHKVFNPSEAGDIDHQFWSTGWLNYRNLGGKSEKDLKIHNTVHGNFISLHFLLEVILDKNSSLLGKKKLLRFATPSDLVSGLQIRANLSNYSLQMSHILHILHNTCSKFLFGRLEVSSLDFRLCKFLILLIKWRETRIHSSYCWEGMKSTNF